jgi:hypothetical protein
MRIPIDGHRVRRAVGCDQHNDISLVPIRKESETVRDRPKSLLSQTSCVKHSDEGDLSLIVLKTNNIMMSCVVFDLHFGSP